MIKQQNAQTFFEVTNERIRHFFAFVRSSKYSSRALVMPTFEFLLIRSQIEVEVY